MGFIISRDCRSCQNFAHTGDLFHNREDWNNYHNGLLHNDWQPREELTEMLEDAKKCWLKFKEMESKIERKDTSMPDWEVNKILKKRKLL